jgi:universal stress protein A
MPFPYKVILCPVDLDERSEEALQEAAVIARATGADLHVLHVVAYIPPVEGVHPDDLYDAKVTLARARIDDMVGKLALRPKPQIAILIGSPGAAIVEMENKLGIDLVVMASHGRKGFKHFVLGSVAEQVARESQVPVLIVRSKIGGNSKELAA